MLAAKDTKAKDHGPCLQGSPSSKLPLCSGLDLLVSMYHLPTMQPCPSKSISVVLKSLENDLQPGLRRETVNNLLK